MHSTRTLVHGKPKATYLESFYCCLVSEQSDLNFESYKRRKFIKCWGGMRRREVAVKAVLPAFPIAIYTVEIFWRQSKWLPAPPLQMRDSELVRH